MIRSRVKSGMANAAAKGHRIGRPKTTKDDIPAVFFKHYPALMTGTMKVSELARVCGLSRPTVYKYLKMVEKGWKGAHELCASILLFFLLFPCSFIVKIGETRSDY